MKTPLQKSPSNTIQPKPTEKDRKIMPPVPFVPAPSTMQVRILGEYYGDTIVNDLYVKKLAGGMTPTDMTNIANTVLNWCTDAFVPALSEHYILNAVQVRDIQV